MRTVALCRVASLIVPLGIVASCAVGCSSGHPSEGGSARDGSAPPGDGSLPSLVDASVNTVNKATLATHSHTVMTVPTAVAVDGTSVTFPDNAEVEALQVGDVIVAAQRINVPYLRTITAVQKNGGSVTMETSQASLSDLFSDFAFTEAVNLGDPDNYDDGSSIQDGTIHLLGGTPGSGSGSGSGGSTTTACPDPKKSCDINWKKQFANGGSAGASAGYTIDMSESYIQVGGGLVFQADYGIFSGLTSLQLALQGNVQAQLGAKITFSGKANYKSPEVQWYSGTVGRFWFTIGFVPIPVYVNVVLTSQFLASASASLTVHAAEIMNIKVEEGVQFANNQWGPVDQKSFNLTSQSPTISAYNITANATIYPMNTKFVFALFNAAGPYVKFNPHFGATLKVQPSGAELDGALGIAIQVGGEITILGKTYKSIGPYTLADPSTSFVLHKWPNQCYVALDGGGGPAWCNEAALKSCATGASSGSCFSKSGTCSNVSIAAGPANEDVVCNQDSLLSCLCSQADGGSTASCFTQHCAPCAQNSLSCSEPN